MSEKRDVSAVIYIRLNVNLSVGEHQVREWDEHHGFRDSFAEHFYEVDEDVLYEQIEEYFRESIAHDGEVFLKTLMEGLTIDNYKLD